MQINFSSTQSHSLSKPDQMSALGQNPTCAPHKGMSALPPIATVKADSDRAKNRQNKFVHCRFCTSACTWPNLKLGNTSRVSAVCPTLTQSGHSHRSGESSILSLLEFAGALRTAVHAGGKSFSFRPLVDEGARSGIFKRRIQSANQDFSDLSQPSPPGTAG